MTKLKKSNFTFFFFLNFHKMSTAKVLPWVEKYRPSNLDDVVSHEACISTIKKFIDKKCLPHLLFHGPPGTGKTTTAIAISHQLYGKDTSMSVLELNASDERGIDTVRMRIKDFASSRSLFGPAIKLIILDESDAMTGAAQAALRRIMEQFTSNVRFILICNYPEKLIPALRSRCTEFRFQPLPDEDAAKFLRRIASEEKLSMDDRGLQALLKLGIGDLRRSINLMQTTAMSNTKEITEANVYRCSGYPLPEEIARTLEQLMNRPLDEALKALNEQVFNNGLSLLDVIRELHSQVVLMEIAPYPLASLIERLAEIERCIAEGSPERVQSAAIASAFQLLRIEIEA